MRSGPTRHRAEPASGDRDFAPPKQMDYDAWVGELVSEVEGEPPASISTQPTSASNTDLIHSISVWTGYVGLAVGFVLTAIAIVRFVS